MLKFKKTLSILTILGFIQFLTAQNIFKAADMGDLKQVDSLLNDNPALLLEKDKEGNTLYHLAALKNDLDLANLIYRFDFSEIDNTNLQGFTALHLASLNGNKRMVEFLIERGADINKKNVKQNISLIDLILMNELQKKKLEITPYLIEKGAKFEVNKANRFGYSPLDMAIVFGATDAAEYLLKFNPEINKIRQLDGKTPLINAITRGRISIARLLIENGADIHVVDNDSYPVIYHAIKKGIIDIAKILIAKNVELVFKDNEGKTLLHLASLSGSYELTEILVKLIPEINAPDKYNKTALYYASKYGHQKIANLLIKNGAKETNDLERNFGISLYLTDKVKMGEAVAWYLNNRGWAIKTKNHLLIFDSEEFGVIRPTEPSLANGFITPLELTNQNVVAIYTAYHGEIGEPAYIHTLENFLPNITYVHNKLDRWRGSDKTIYMEAEGKKNIGDLKIFSISVQESMPALGYLCMVDNLTIFYSGFRTDNFDNYKKEIDYLAHFTKSIDLAFLPIEEAEEPPKEALHFINILNPKVVLLLDPDRREYLFPNVKKQIENKKPGIKIFCAKHPGDHFFFDKP